MQHYLVVIDTIGRQAKGFRPGIQNFYIALAPGEGEAKNIVLSTFKLNPILLNQLLPCTSATPLNRITNLLTPNQALWSYIPFKGIKAPGQQKLIPSPESLVEAQPRFENMEERSKENFKPSIKQLAPIKTYEAQNDRDKEKMDPTDMLLSDPAFVEKLKAKLLGLPAPAAIVDPEARLRFNDEGSSYDDRLDTPGTENTLPPQQQRSSQASFVQKAGLPTTVPLGGIPGMIEPDQETTMRLRSNIRTINLETQEDN